MDEDEEPKIIPKNIPDYEYELIARSFLPFVLKYFENEENKTGGATIELSEGPKLRYNANFGPRDLNFDFKIINPY